MQTFRVQVSLGLLQVPHEATVRRRPQLSFALRAPQSARCHAQNSAFDWLTQPQTFASPSPPQVKGDEQVPQLPVRASPQSSTQLTLPQSKPRSSQ